MTRCLSAYLSFTVVGEYIVFYLLLFGRAPLQSTPTTDSRTSFSPRLTVAHLFRLEMTPGLEKSMQGCLVVGAEE